MDSFHYDNGASPYAAVIYGPPTTPTKPMTQTRSGLHTRPVERHDLVAPDRRLTDLIAASAIPPFVYTYPPRSAYRPLEPTWTATRIWNEDRVYSGDDLNLYVHVPFCRYKCGFCNLYTVVARDEVLYESYVTAVCRQLLQSADIIAQRVVRTVYIGGGTPALLAPRHLQRILTTLDTIAPAWRSTVEELCIEATPDSIATGDAAPKLVDLGFTRVNMGVQSMKTDELRRAGRAAATGSVVRLAVRRLQEVGLSNLSLDLIMGFEGQTDETWLESVADVIAMAPETISTYFLTVRPDAWFSASGRYQYARDGRLYQRYDAARDLLQAAGYIQESNVRYKLPPRGGYVQKVLQFRGVPVLGIGAGARSYTNTADYLVGGGAKPNLSQVITYMTAVERGEVHLAAGFVYDDDERVRKRLALDLFDLDLVDLRLPVDPAMLDILAGAVAVGLVKQLTPTRYAMTATGYKYRDILSWTFFSNRVLQLDDAFYTVLHAANARAVRKLPAPTYGAQFR